VVLSRSVRILVDYRPALRERTGVGEYVHELVRAYTSLPDAQQDQVSLFTSSWRDRPHAGLDRELRVRVVDRRLPVRALNYVWHRLEAPAVEWLAGAADVVHAQHPLLIPARHAAQVVTIHDLFFLTAPERTRAEIRRDYPGLAPGHARRAHAVLTSSRYSAGRIARELNVDSDRIYVCPPGAPRWHELGRGPHVPADGYLLFIGTLEPRKNLGVLLDAYASLLGGSRRLPKLVLAGRSTPDAEAWLDRIARAPLAGHVEHRGYVSAPEREALFAGARLLVMPSLDEGFGLPVLEAMSAGIPVVATDRGSLPEVLGNAGPLVDARNPDALSAAMQRMIDDDSYARSCASTGLDRAATFSWTRTATIVRQMYLDAIARRRAA
jgi:glycosyltransferase involved in cell wall biosynthesis